MLRAGVFVFVQCAINVQCLYALCTPLDLLVLSKTAQTQAVAWTGGGGRAGKGE